VMADQCDRHNQGHQTRAVIGNYPLQLLDCHQSARAAPAGMPTHRAEPARR
jgi:hypothetical protein